MTKGVLEEHQTLLNQGKFFIQACHHCNASIYFPREICPHCSSTDLGWIEPTGLGTIYALTTVRRKVEAGGDFNVSIIELDEKVRLMSRVETQHSQTNLKIGDRVKARVQVKEGQGLVVFDLAAEVL